MLLTLGTIAITSGTLYIGAKAIASHKKKKEQPWTFAAEKLRKRKNKANVLQINRLNVFDPEDNPSVFDKLLTPLLGKQRNQLQQITGQKIETSAEEKRMDLRPQYKRYSYCRQNRRHNHVMRYG